MDLIDLGLLGLMSSIAAIGASPIARIHVKFVQDPHIFEHGIVTDGGRTLLQQSYLSIGRRNVNSWPVNGSYQNYGNRMLQPNIIRPENAVPLWLKSEYHGPNSQTNHGGNFHGYSRKTPDFSNGLDYPDPLLLTGEDAKRAVKYIYGRGELFFDDIPHLRAILRNQEERRLNGLHGHILNSLRPSSPFYRYKDKN